MTIGVSDGCLLWLSSLVSRAQRVGALSFSFQRSAIFLSPFSVLFSVEAVAGA